MIAFSEGTSAAGRNPVTCNDGYDVVVTGIDGIHEIFTDYKEHPFAGGRQSKQINKKGLKSSASGRYQFMKKDWPHYRDSLCLPDFGPESQDRWAVQLICECRALDDIENGRFQDAVFKCRKIWASLPGSGYGQPENKLAALEYEYRKAGGDVNLPV